MNTKDTSGLLASVVKWAAIIGLISFAGGFIGPIFLSSSNLGPLLGIFVTGPLGVLVGALWGAVHWGYAPQSEVSAVTRWIVLLWIITLFYTLFMVGLAARFALPGVGVLVLILLASAFLLYQHGTRKRLPRMVQQCGRIFLAVNTVVVAMTLFPPVMRPGWGPSAVSAHGAASSSLPMVAFLLHPGFDASKHVPEFTVNVRVLLLEWMTALVAGVLTCYLLVRRTGKAASA